MVNILEKYTGPNGSIINGANYIYGGNCNEFTPDASLEAYPYQPYIYLTVDKKPPFIDLAAFDERSLYDYLGVDEQGYHMWKRNDKNSYGTLRPSPGLVDTYMYFSGITVNTTTNISNTHYNDDNCRFLIGVEKPFTIPSNAKIINLFSGKKLGDMDLSQWDVSRTGCMPAMFNGCRSITKLNLSGWDMRNKTGNHNYPLSDMDYRNLLVIYYNPSNHNYTGLELMFGGCRSLTEIQGIENWDIRGTTYLGAMFAGCQSLKRLDLSGWSLSDNTIMPFMFYNTGLEELSIAGWDATKIISTSSRGVYSILGGTTFNTLRVLDVSGFEVVSLPIDIKSIFFNKSGLQSKSVTTVRAYGLSDASVTYLQGWFPNAEILR